MNTHPSQVHNEVTTVLNADFESYGSYRRHEHSDEYEAAWAVYDFLDYNIQPGDDLTSHSTSQPKSSLLSSCRSNAWFSRHRDSGEVRIISNACHLRWCPVCSDSRRNFIGFEVADWLKKQKYPKLMTLTLKHRDIPLFHQIDQLYRYFSKLRKLKDFRDIVSGGVWFFQIKQTGKNNEWHPHIHCVVTGKYLPRRLLRNLWFKLTGDSIIVDIRSVKDPEGCALEVARYAARPGPLKDLTLNDAVDLVSVMHGKRICGTWGTGRDISLKPPKCEDKDKWQSIGSWGMVMRNRKTDSKCKAIYSAWEKNEPLPSGVNCWRHEDRKRGQHVFIADENTVLEQIYSESWVPP